MKFVLLALMIAVCLCRLSTKEQNGQINFDLDVHSESPVGVVLKGLIDPRQETNNQIGAFLKLANTYIPILESLASADNSLNYERNWNINFLGMNFDIYWYFQLIVGWKVTPGEYSSSFYQITYTPFVHGSTLGYVNGTTWPIVGSTKVGLQYLYAYAPIGVTIYTTDKKVCFGGDYTVDPIELRTQVYVALNECSAEIFDEIIEQTPIHLNCNYTAYQNFTLLNINFTNTYTGDILSDICFNY